MLLLVRCFSYFTTRSTLLTSEQAPVEAGIVSIEPAEVSGDPVPPPPIPIPSTPVKGILKTKKGPKSTKKVMFAEDGPPRKRVKLKLSS